MVTCAVFLRLNSLLKLAVLLLAVAVYTYLIHLAFLALTRADVLHRSVMPQGPLRMCKYTPKLPGQLTYLEQSLYLVHTLTTFKC